MPARTCIYTKPNGIQCGSPALRGKVRCHYHISEPKMHRLDERLDINSFQDRAQALSDVFHALCENRITLERARILLKALHMAMCVDFREQAAREQRIPLPPRAGG
jgi:hypothetical protein